MAAHIRSPPPCAPQGLESFLKQTAQVIFGADSPLVKEERIAVVQVRCSCRHHRSLACFHLQQRALFAECAQHEPHLESHVLQSATEAHGGGGGERRRRAKSGAVNLVQRLR